MLPEREAISAALLDENGDLHAEGETAISYSAGFMHYFFWNGIPVPETVGMIPSAAITPDYIRGHSTWLERNILIARMGLENFLAESDAKVTHEDETGKLWKARFGRGNTYSWSVVEVINGSPEPDGKFKRYFLQVPQPCGPTDKRLLRRTGFMRTSIRWQCERNFDGRA